MEQSKHIITMVVFFWIMAIRVCADSAGITTQEKLAPVEYEKIPTTDGNLIPIVQPENTSSVIRTDAVHTSAIKTNADHTSAQAISSPMPAPSLSQEPEKGLIALFTKGDAQQRREFVERVSLIPIFRKGGPIMWPLLFASILALGTVLDRFLFLLSVFSRRDARGMENFFAALGNGDFEHAIGIAQRSRYYVLRMLGFALTHKEKSLSNALILAQELEIQRFRRGIPMLDSIITLAPLLGLLGTVTGMMGSFSLIGGELSTPGTVTGGIAEALIATAFGLGIAITSLIPFNILNNKLDEARLEMESASTRLELLLNPAKSSRVSKSRENSAAQNGNSAPTRGLIPKPPSKTLVLAGK